MNDITYVGLDVHKTSISVAVAEKHGTPQYLGRIVNTPQAIRQQMEKLGLPSQLRVTYEAGPTGYGIYRQLHQQGIDCLVAAPSLIPRRPGDRVKNDRRDSVKLARLLHSVNLTPVWIPNQDQEALRDLMRGRVSLVKEVTRLKNRLSTFLLRQRITSPARLRTACTGSWWNTPGTAGANQLKAPVGGGSRRGVPCSPERPAAQGLSPECMTGNEDGIGGGCSNRIYG